MVELEIVVADTEAQYAAARPLVEEYASQLGIDLAFQNFAAELEQLRTMYGPPRGRLLLGVCGGELAGCVAVRDIAADVCEMKRLYVRAAFRGRGLGRALALASLEAARGLGYRRMVLDTLATMETAVSLYMSLGFRETEPYYPNPLPDVRYLAIALVRPGSD